MMVGGMESIYLIIYMAISFICLWVVPKDETTSFVLYSICFNGAGSN